MKTDPSRARGSEEAVIEVQRSEEPVDRHGQGQQRTLSTVEGAPGRESGMSQRHYTP